MRFETLADLIDAYKTGELSESVPLIIDRENGIAYIQMTDTESYDEDIDFEDRYLFYLNLSEIVYEAAEILGIPFESD